MSTRVAVFAAGGSAMGAVRARGRRARRRRVRCMVIGGL